MSRGFPGVPPGGLRLDELARELPGGATIEGDPSTRVFGVHHDSRAVEPGDLFVARRGAHADGRRFVQDACDRGAAAVLGARGTVAHGVPLLHVDDVATGLAFAAAATYGHPSFSLEVAGVTGTNGKTTTTHLVAAALPACGLIGTVGHRYGDLVIPAEHTTPEADETARILARFRAARAERVAMEVSSIALSAGRARAIRFRVAAFTNLTQDHLDYHGDMAAYAAAKALLFTGAGAAVINVADPFGAELAGRVRAPLVRVSARASDRADVAPLEARCDRSGIAARLRTPAGELALTSPLVGAHNLENLVVTVGIVYAMDGNLQDAAEALRHARGAPGRLERCEGPADDIAVLVDYAHTPDALAKVLASVRDVTDGRVLCVFGCGGDRDPTKREPMGLAVARGADVAIVTNDNPRTEHPQTIAGAILLGLRAGNASEVIVELDRAQAIAVAVRVARRGDVVLIAGKGHEKYQVIGEERRPFDDRAEAARALAERRGG